MGSKSRRFLFIWPIYETVLRFKIEYVILVLSLVVRITQIHRDNASFLLINFFYIFIIFLVYTNLPHIK